jgi:probable rRNA maturation factor
VDPATDDRVEQLAGIRSIAAGGREEADRARPVYVDDCRVDIVRRSGTPPLGSDASLARAVARAVEACEAPPPASVTVVLTDDAELEELNLAHLAKSEPTDVLSFPMLPPAAFPPHPGKGAATNAPTAAPAPQRVSPGARVHLGDIAISVERAIRQAEEGRGGQTGDVRWSPVDEIRLLATHGTLHLCGWDHADPEEEAAMRALEQRLLAEERR